MMVFNGLAVALKHPFGFEPVGTQMFIHDHSVQDRRFLCLLQHRSSSRLYLIQPVHLAEGWIQNRGAGGLPLRPDS